MRFPCLHCRRAHMRGLASEVSPSSGFRFVCYCKDCQAFARFLERADVLDAASGTDIFQMPPGRIKLTVGADALRCLCLGNRGVFRWYADCCRTPIANTADRPGFPVIGVIHSFMDQKFLDQDFMDHPAGGRSRDDVLGPPCRIHERSATGPLPPPASFGVFARRAAKALVWWMRGFARPSPFFDDRTDAPRSMPRVLTPSERAAL